MDNRQRTTGRTGKTKEEDIRYGRKGNRQRTIHKFFYKKEVYK